jgi:hypothetical protein
LIQEAPYLFSVAALSVSLAGFAGLVAAFRPGGEWTAMTVFRLREIAEFGFGNAVVALVVIPAVTTVGDIAGLRFAAALGVVFLVGHSLVLIRRQAALALPRGRWWYGFGAVLDVGVIAAGVGAYMSASIGLFEWELLFLLARPMLAFTLVLASLRHD